MSVWSGEYVSAVSAFSLRMTRLTERGFSVTHERLAIGQNGPNEENLAIDVAWIGPSDGSAPTNIFEFDDIIFYTAIIGNTGNELWSAELVESIDYY